MSEAPEMPDSSPRFDLESVRSVLVVKPSSLGDVIHTLPAVTRLWEARPDLEIDWVVNTEWAPLLEGHPGLRRVIPMPRREWRGWKDLPKARRWARENLGLLEPDLVLDFQGLLRSALLSKAAGGGHVVGFRRAREGASLLYDQRVDIANWESTHAVRRYLAMVEALGVEGIPTDGERDPSSLFPLPEGEEVSLPEQGWPDQGPYVLLHPFSRGRGKSMNFAEVSEFCEKVGEQVPVVLVGAGVTWPTDSEEAIARPANLVDLLNRTTLSELIWLMRRARFIVSVDSGPMHLAAAITGQLLSIHTWTDPLMVGPCRDDAWIWREGFLGPVGKVRPGQFPERRMDRDRYARGIFTGQDMETLAEFVVERFPA